MKKKISNIRIPFYRLEYEIYQGDYDSYRVECYETENIKEIESLVNALSALQQIKPNERSFRGVPEYDAFFEDRWVGSNILPYHNYLESVGISIVKRKHFNPSTYPDLMNTFRTHMFFKEDLELSMDEVRNIIQEYLKTLNPFDLSLTNTEEYHTVSHWNVYLYTDDGKYEVEVKHTSSQDLIDDRKDTNRFEESYKIYTI